MVPLLLKTASRPVDRTIALPGSKSLTNRALLAAALAEGISHLNGILLAGDTLRMMNCLRALGVRIDVEHDPRRATIHGCGGHWPGDEADLDCGDAGTVARFLTGAAAAGVGRYRLDGSPRLRQRPIAPLLDALRDLGAMIGADGGADGDTTGLPLTISARGLRGGTTRIDAADSSQFVSALLMAAPRAASDVLIELSGDLPSQPYVAMTLAVLRDFGVSFVDDNMRRFIVPAPQAYQSREYAVEPDASAASYFWAAAAATGGRVTVEGIGMHSVQGDTKFVDVLERMGCRVERGPQSTTVRGPECGRLKGVDVDLNAMPDTAPTLAVLAIFADGPTRIRGVANLRHKESDRLAALAEGLRRLGVATELHDDGMTIRPGGAMKGAVIDPHGDHRIAMSFAIAGLRIDDVAIADSDCVAKTFPEFFEAWATMLA